MDGANRAVTEALKEAPEYADAHAILALIHLARGERDRAETELREAERLDPDMVTLPMMWADYYASGGDLARAAEYAKKSLKAASHNWQVRLKAGMIFRAAGLYDEMRKEARAVMDMISPEQRGTMEQRILQILGPTALEEPLDDDEEL
ncbi:MAG: tetratricopeptide repeat protein, partial [Myxococcales bacterium]|nr:tetratricopeptide repeat protein [Myxococcales bacterium]